MTKVSASMGDTPLYNETGESRSVLKEITEKVGTFIMGTLLVGGLFFVGMTKNACSCEIHYMMPMLVPISLAVGSVVSFGVVFCGR